MVVKPAKSVENRMVINPNYCVDLEESHNAFI